MSTTISMWLGIAFLGLGVAATILQAWLWKFPMAPDPGGPDPHGRSTAPRMWTNAHRVIGVAFVVIYVVMMVEMIPRLWEYQVELPARTVMHAVMGIVIGMLIIAKISIIRWFQHFGKALPQLGFGILTCTVILAVLSVPYALRAHDFGAASTPENLARVERLLAPLELDRPADELATEDALGEGRDVLTGKCVICHDLRTILKRPYSPSGWHRVVTRMMAKPQLMRALNDDDIAPVTAYLVAITPTLQQSVKAKRETEQAQETRVQEAAAAMAPSAAATTAAASPVPAATAETTAAAKSLYEDACSQCHELSEVDAVGPQTAKQWAETVTRMIEEEEAEIDAEHAAQIVAYLVKTKGAPSP